MLLSITGILSIPPANTRTHTFDVIRPSGARRVINLMGSSLIVFFVYAVANITKTIRALPSKFRSVSTHVGELQNVRLLILFRSCEKLSPDTIDRSGRFLRRLVAANQMRKLEIAHTARLILLCVCYSNRIEKESGTYTCMIIYKYAHAGRDSGR